MAFNSVTFKKSMLAWDAVAKKGPEGIKKLAAEHPEAASEINTIAKAVSAYNKSLRDLLDKVLNAKDPKAQTDAAKSALSNAKQYQNFVATSHLPPEVLTILKNGLADLVKGLAT